VKGGVETELKYRLSGPDEHARLRARLVERDAVPVGVQTEENMLYSAGPRHPLEPGAVLRLRTLDGGPRAIVTFKGPAEFAGGVTTRREVEAAVDDTGDAANLLAALGYTPSLQYRKTRETWRLDDVEVALDTLEFGCFCELEGLGPRIQRLADLLGLRPDQLETRGYGALQGEADAAL
jgi:predicted adenylyl cyclase CyaB